MKNSENVGWAHCLHHGVHPIELCNDYMGRVAVIKHDKPVGEQPLRLANFWLYPPGALPKELAVFDKELAVFNKELAVFDQEQATLDKKRDALDKEQAALGKEQAVFDQEQATLDKKRDALDKGWDALDKGWDALGKKWAELYQEQAPMIQALHDKLVSEGCVCTWNGTDIFPKEAPNG